jgi:predicted nucleotidyltransferase
MEIADSKLEKAILNTLAYFDIFAYPLTLVEIWKWLYFKEAASSAILLNKIKETIDNNEKIKSLIDNKWGFYFFKGRELVIELRRERYNLAEEKFKKAIRVVKFLKWMPGIKMIGVCNSLAWGNASEESDIDFFIVTEKNKIWTARFFAVIFLKIFGLRPRKNKTRNKICLSFFVDEENLNLERLAMDDADIYLIYWINQVVPIFDKGGVYEYFLESNRWVKNFLPNIFDSEGSERRREHSFFRKSAPVGKDSIIEKILGKLQLKIMPKEMKERINCDGGVILSDGVLKFHCNDRRREYQKKWFQKIESL